MANLSIIASQMQIMPGVKTEPRSKADIGPKEKSPKKEESPHLSKSKLEK